MKKIKFLATLLAAGALVACNETIEPQGSGENTPYEGEAGYINISLNLPTTSGTNTKANDYFDDGIASEYNVNNAIIALFYGSNEASATCKYAFRLNQTDFQTTGTTTDNITSYYASGVRMIEAPGANENVYALAILNAPSSDFPYSVTTTNDNNENTGDAVLTTKLQKSGSDFTGTLDEFTQSSATYNANIASTSSEGNFLMTNAPIAKSASFSNTNKPSDNDYVRTLAPITVYNEKNLAEGAASANPIYVERAVAKTTVKVGDTDNTLEVKSEVPAYNGATVKFEGWKLQNTNKKYNYVRNVSNWDTWIEYFNEGTAFGPNEINRFFGEQANPYRTYWGIDPNYNAISEIELVNNFNILNQSQEASITWNTVGNNSTTSYSGKLVEYCAENTTLAKVMQEDQLTGVLLKATFTPEGANANSNFFMLNNTSAIYTENGDHGFIAWASAVLANGGEGIPLEDGETLSIKDGVTAGTITTAAGVKALLKTSSTSPNDELTDDQANAILSAAGNNIKFYEGGVTYYYTTLIEHFGNTQTPLGSTPISTAQNYDEAKHLGRYGVVRNNWYELNITSVSGPGDPIIPEIPTTPPDKTNSYINCEINVLSWAKRSQDVDL